MAMHPEKKRLRKEGSVGRQNPYDAGTPCIDGIYNHLITSELSRSYRCGLVVLRLHSSEAG
jgi:hypothetical protein